MCFGFSFWNGKDPILKERLFGLTCLIGNTIIESSLLEKLKDFNGRLNWFQRQRTVQNKYSAIESREEGKDILLSLVHRNRLERILKMMLDESEFLSDYGIRAISKHHEREYFSINENGQEFGIRYEAAESTTGMFCGNSNWRGPTDLDAYELPDPRISL